MKKKLFIGIAILFVLHFVTWKMWGDVSLLKKGFKDLEENEGCTRMFSGLARTEIYGGKEFKYTSQRIYISRITRDRTDISVNLINILGESKKVLGYREGLLDSLNKVTGETNELHQLIFVEGNWIPMNPYLVDANFYCWVLGSDVDEGYEPLLIWAFVGWIDIANKFTYPIYEIYVD